MHASTTPQIPVTARRAVDAYVAEVREALRGLPADQFREAVADLRDYFAEVLPRDAGPDEVAAAAAELGTPSSYAAGIIGGTATRPSPPPSEDGAAVGEVLGVPYDVRPPSAGRIASRWWDPASPHIFVPRVFGLGWDLNFGAIAVKAGLIRPDDEDEPFASVPQSAFVAALMIPVAIAVVVLAIAVAAQGRLSPQIPMHWAWNGIPDWFWAKQWVLGLTLLVTLVPTGFAVAAVVLRRKPAHQAALIAAATFLGTLGLAQYAQSALWGLGFHYGPAVQLSIIFAMLAGAFGLTFAELVVLARIGRAAEWDRDLKPSERGGSR